MSDRIDVNPIAEQVAAFIVDGMDRLDYGELIATVRLHAGRVPIVQLTETRSIKTDSPHNAGNPGGRHDHRER
jgi:hypothetical protein